MAYVSIDVDDTAQSFPETFYPKFTAIGDGFAGTYDGFQEKDDEYQGKPRKKITWYFRDATYTSTMDPKRAGTNIAAEALGVNGTKTLNDRLKRALEMGLLTKGAKVTGKLARKIPLAKSNNTMPGWDAAVEPVSAAPAAAATPPTEDDLPF